MIRINLLPPQMRRAAGPLLKLAGLPWREIGIGVGAILLLYTGRLLWMTHAQSQALAHLTAEWKALQPRQAKLQETRGRLNALKNRSTIMQGVKAPEQQWAPRLNLLSDSLVANLWFTRFAFRSVRGGEAGELLSEEFKDLIPLEEQQPRRPEAVQKKGTAAATRGKPQPAEKLFAVLEGSALVVGGDTQAPVSRFLQRLKENPEFGKRFGKVDLKNVSHRQVQQEEVSDFVVLLSPTGS